MAPNLVRHPWSFRCPWNLECGGWSTFTPPLHTAHAARCGLFLPRRSYQTQAIRLELRGLAEIGLERIWPSHASQGPQLRPKDNSQSLYDHLQMLAPKNETQAAVKGAAISAAINLRHTYWLMFLGTEQSSLSLPLLAVVVLWLTFIFTSFGLFAPRTKTIFVTLLACALAVSGAIFIIMAMYTPFSGVMKISSDPIRNALSMMGH